MSDKYIARHAHDSFPIAAPALQRTSLKPDFNYIDTNLARELSAHLKRTEPSFSAGELSAIGLMGKASLSVIQNYLDSAQISFSALDRYLLDEMGLETARSSLLEVVGRFPTPLSHAEPGQNFVYTLGEHSSETARHSYFFSLLLILVAEHNPSFLSRDGFFTDPALRESPLFIELLSCLQDFYSLPSAKIPGGISLVDFLLEPSRLYPDSIFDQLQFIAKRWSHLLAPDLLRSLLINLDRLKEENRSVDTAPGVAEDPLGHLSSSDFLENDLVQFSPDQDWMPRVILQAKNVYVWLDQLSREYNIQITRLDQIPVQELRKLSRRGINALWLIGLWERSPASQQIKKICGNPEAVSSAYSLYDYTIAESLGGEEAYQQLSASASTFNIRLAADMVPNHMGIVSRWITEHPEWFLSLDSSPFPGYTFRGVDLSIDPAVSIHLEDHYYNKSDAAVVFKRFDHHSGETRYIYHGNDGTSMPWNDTAQLDFLNPEVREAVIQTILHVAKKFPIIRFDAAMTLSKKHYQRLWFPQPGSGGAIPTRADFSLTKSQFNARMPREFWREVVDRVAEDVPGTLLLAEAFWMMEGYFVRNLGMHRVYNSAFMHMLRDEDNKKYRELIINTLEYDPQILKRYVNFMNNPDEDTALAQFGSGGKYFGICVMMSTLPGLPMFGHGQIEGFSEKYGMEYKKAYYEEEADPAFLERHQREIFPLLHKRYLFAEVDFFYLFNYTTLDQAVNEDVFAYSNRSGLESALIIYHNKWGETKGFIFKSAPVNGESVELLSGLGLSSSSGDYLVFTDRMTGLEYIRSLRELSAQGLYIELGAYRYHVFMDFRVISDQDGSYALLSAALNGSGVPDILKRRAEIIYAPLVNLVSGFIRNWQNEKILLDDPGQERSVIDTDRILQISSASGTAFFDELSALFPEIELDHIALHKSFQQRISALIGFFSDPPEGTSSLETALLSWSFLADLSTVLDQGDLGMIIEALTASLADFEPLSGEDRESLGRILSMLVSLSPLLADKSSDPGSLSELWFSNTATQKFINLHNFEGHTWFHKESMETLIKLTFSLLSLEYRKDNSRDFSLSPDYEKELNAHLSKALKALNASDFRADLFISIISDDLPGM